MLIPDQTLIFKSFITQVNFMTESTISNHVDIVKLTYRLPLTIYHLPPTTYHLPFTTYHPITTYHLPLNIYHLPPTYHLPLTTYHLPRLLFVQELPIATRPLVSHKPDLPYHITAAACDCPMTDRIW